MEILEESIDFPESSVGAPCPTIIASEHKVILFYYTSNDDDIAIISFEHCFEHRLGMPSEDEVSGHPLGAIGLKPFTNYKVINSSLIKEIEKRYKTISEFSKGTRNYIHYIFVFHDRTFECIASKFTIEINKTQISINKLLRSYIESLV